MKISPLATQSLPMVRTITGGPVAVSMAKSRLSHRAPTLALSGHWALILQQAIEMGPPLDAPDSLPAGYANFRELTNSSGRAWPAPATVPR